MAGIYAPRSNEHTGIAADIRNAETHMASCRERVEESTKMEAADLLQHVDQTLPEPAAAWVPSEPGHQIGEPQPITAMFMAQAPRERWGDIPVQGSSWAGRYSLLPLWF